MKTRRLAHMAVVALCLAFPIMAPAEEQTTLFLRSNGDVCRNSPGLNNTAFSLDTPAPTNTEGKCRDSPAVRRAAFEEIGTWSSARSEVGQGLASLSDLHVWIGLKTSDDVGTAFDLRAELRKNGVTISSGETKDIQGVGRNPAQAKEATIRFGNLSDSQLNPGDVLSLRVLTKVADQGGHGNAVGLRLYYDATSRPARLGVTFLSGIPTGDILVVSDPTAFFTNVSTRVRFQAHALPAPGLNPDNVFLFEVDEGFRALGPALCQLRDNGDPGTGDDIGGDSVFSCFVTFLEAAPKRVRLGAHVDIAGRTFSSPAAFLDIVAPLTQQDAEIVVQTQAAAFQIWLANLARFGDSLTARQATADAIKELPGVGNSGVSVDGFTVWIKYQNGLNGGLMLNPEGTRGHGTVGPGAPGPFGDASPDEWVAPRASSIPPPPQTATPFSLAVHASAGAAPTPVGNNKVLIWDAFNSQFSPYDEGPQLKTLFQSAAMCPPFTVTYLADAQATVNSVRTFTQYGTVILVTHGIVDGDNLVVFATREITTPLSISANALDLILGRLSIVNNVYGIRPGFISTLPGAFGNAILYGGHCQSSTNSTMQDAFLSKGVKTAYGYTGTVNSFFAEIVANQLFTNLASSLMTTGDAFASVTPKVDPINPTTAFTQSGDGNVAYSTPTVFEGPVVATGTTTYLACAWFETWDLETTVTLSGETGTAVVSGTKTSVPLVAGCGNYSVPVQQGFPLSVSGQSGEVIQGSYLWPPCGEGCGAYSLSMQGTISGTTINGAVDILTVGLGESGGQQGYFALKAVSCPE